MKTVIDAVNNYKGVFPFDRPSIIYHSGMGKYSDYYDEDNAALSTTWQFVCGREEFNQCVDEMSTNYGLMSTGALLRWQHGIKESNLAPTVAVYTQAMCNAKKLPPIGSYAKLSIYAIDDNNDVFIEGDRVLIGGHANFGGEDVAVYAKGNSTGTSIASGFKPLTPPIKLIDGKAYQFTYGNTPTITGLYSKIHKQLQAIAGHYDVRHCTNIQPLTVEVKS